MVPQRGAPSKEWSLKGVHRQRSGPVPQRNGPAGPSAGGCCLSAEAARRTWPDDEGGTGVPGLMTGEGAGISSTRPAKDMVVLLHLFRMLELLDRLKLRPIRPATQERSWLVSGFPQTFCDKIPGLFQDQICFFKDLDVL